MREEAIILPIAVEELARTGSMTGEVLVVLGVESEEERPSTAEAAASSYLALLTLDASSGLICERRRLLGSLGRLEEGVVEMGVRGERRLGRPESETYVQPEVSFLGLTMRRKSFTPYLILVLCFNSPLRYEWANSLIALNRG